MEPSPPSTIEPGRIVDGRYRVDALLGKGGMGAVYRATHVALGRPVALKVLLARLAADGEAAARFAREARTLSRIKHPSVVTIYDFGVAEGVGAYLVMEYLEGRSLGDELRRAGRLDPPVAVEIVARVCGAVGAAHEMGIVHRDLKPDNVFLEAGPRGATAVKVLDFGVAKLVETAGEAGTTLTGRGSAVGTPLYMSPEQCAGEAVDARADVYALGCLLYEAIAGRPPFEGASAHEVMARHLTAQPAPLKRLGAPVPPELDIAVLRALAKRPEERFATAAELARAIAPFGGGAIVAATEAAPAAERPPTGPTPATAATQVEDRRTVREAPHNLPRPLTSFVGRAEEVAALRRLLGEARLVTLVGPGGIGKTRLALEAAWEALDDYPDGAWLVELAPVADPALVPKAVASAAGVRESGGEPLARTLAAALGPRRALVVLDNCEHLVDACAAVAEELLRAGHGLRVLATSREPLEVYGEHVWAVPVLATPAAEAGATLETLARSDAARLFADRARQSAPSFRLSDRNAAAVARLVRELDGIPLALELAAANLRSLSVEQLLERLSGRLHTLGGGARRAQPRQQTLRAAIDWSHDLLSEPERRLLRRLSVFAGGWTLEAAEAVCPDAGGRDEDVLATLTSLVNKSLVAVDDRGETVRYRMLETIREYASEKLAAAGEDARLAERHAAWAIELAERAHARLWGPEQREWFARLGEEHDNMRAALAWCAAPGAPGGALLRLAVALGRFWFIRGHAAEGRRWLERAIEASPEAPPGLWAAARIGLGLLVGNRHGDYDRARALFEAALGAARAAGDLTTSAQALRLLGYALQNLGRYDDAAASHREAQAIYRRLGDALGLAAMAGDLGLMALDAGDWDSAARHFEEAIALNRSVGNKAGVATGLHNLGETMQKRGDAAAARRYLAECLEICAELDNQSLAGYTRFVLGYVAVGTGELAEAYGHFAEAARVCRRIGDAAGVVYTLEGLACLAAARGEALLAIHVASAAEAERERMKIVRTPSELAFVDRFLAGALAAVSPEDGRREAARGRMTALDAAADLALAALAPAE